jgi:hypothetical protein
MRSREVQRAFSRNKFHTGPPPGYLHDSLVLFYHSNLVFWDLVSASKQRKICGLSTVENCLLEALAEYKAGLMHMDIMALRPLATALVPID